MHEAPKRPTGVPQTAFVPRATLPVVIYFLSVSGRLSQTGEIPLEPYIDMER